MHPRGTPAVAAPAVAGIAPGDYTAGNMCFEHPICRGCVRARMRYAKPAGWGRFSVRATGSGGLADADHRWPAPRPAGIGLRAAALNDLFSRPMRSSTRRWTARSSRSSRHLRTDGGRVRRALRLVPAHGRTAVGPESAHAGQQCAHHQVLRSVALCRQRPNPDQQHFPPAARDFPEDEVARVHANPDRRFQRLARTRRQNQYQTMTTPGPGARGKVAPFM
jgi:hypothetical protein